MVYPTLIKLLFYQRQLVSAQLYSFHSYFYQNIAYHTLTQNLNQCETVLAHFYSFQHNSNQIWPTLKTAF